MLRSRIGAAAVVLALAAMAAALVPGGPSGAASRRYTIAFVPGEPKDNPRDQAIARGGRAAAKALGVRFIYTAEGPDIINSLIARHVDAIATEGYDPSYKPLLAKARAAGILVLSSGDDIDAKRSVWVNFTNPTAYAEALADALASQMGRRGEYAILTEQGQFPIADEWTRLVKAYVPKAYPEMKLDAVVQESGGGGDGEIASIEQFMAAHPHLRGLIGIAPTEGWVESQAIMRAHKIGKVFSAGNGGGDFGPPLPSFVRSGAAELVYVGDQTKIGYLTVWAAHYLLTGHRFRPGAYQIGGPIGLVWYHASHQELRLGQPLTITKANVDVYANGF